MERSSSLIATLATQAYSLLTLMLRNNKQITLQLHLQEHFEELVFTLTCMPIKRNLRFVLKGRILNMRFLSDMSIIFWTCCCISKSVNSLTDCCGLLYKNTTDHIDTF